MVHGSKHRCVSGQSTNSRVVIDLRGLNTYITCRIPIDFRGINRPNVPIT